MRLLFPFALAACAAADGPSDDTDAVAADPTPVFMPLDASNEVVTAVELERYVGAWYEIGTFVIPFQSACTGSTAAYAPIDATTISVRNRCLIDSLDGRPFVIEGTAALQNETATRLGVTFFGTGAAPYWVVELDGRPGDAPYDWAVVSGPDQATLWILHRQPQMPDTLLDPVVERLAERGWDTARISWTVQPEEAFPVEEVVGAGGAM